MTLLNICFAATLFLLVAPGLTSVSWAITTTAMRGSAEVSYVKYDSEVGGKKTFSGDTLAQQYSLAYYATNLYYRGQPRYFDLKLRYNLVSYDTSISTPEQDISLSETMGKFSYNGEVGYNASELPVRFRAYSNDDQPYRFRYNSSDITLINDGLIYALEGFGTNRNSGVFIDFNPSRAHSEKLYGLPRMFLDYRETVNKASYGSYHVDNKIKQLAVAGLNQQNNWLHYRTVDYENNLNHFDDYKEQHIQIGMVDHIGRRKWSALTNWIDFSADGRLTNINSPDPDKVLEEYDANFMAIATRRTWNARTFMNYNRQIDNNARTETAIIPLYLKGLYGSNADWHLGLAASRGREQRWGSKDAETSFRNSMNAGATTYKQANFILSPAISLATYRSFGQDYDAYSAETSITATSTRRFSRKADLAAKILWRGTDDGTDTKASRSWSSLADISAIYRINSQFTGKLTEQLEAGSGTGYIDPGRLRADSSKNENKLGTYTRNYLKGELTWAKTARMTTSFSAAYDAIKASGYPLNEKINLNYRFSYNQQASSYHLDSRYEWFNSGITSAEISWQTYGEFLYRPDRYNDAQLRLTHKREERAFMTTPTDELDILQRYIRNFYSRAGVIRNLGALTEEYSYELSKFNGRSTSTQYLMLAGRYNPTSRLSLYGSVKYEKYSNGAVAMYYNGGVNADLALLSTSLDYSYAKRDKDDRIEKKISASVKRTF